MNSTLIPLSFLLYFYYHNYILTYLFTCQPPFLDSEDRKSCQCPMPSALLLHSFFNFFLNDVTNGLVSQSSQSIHLINIYRAPALCVNCFRKLILSPDLKLAASELVPRELLEQFWAHPWWFRYYRLKPGTPTTSIWKLPR